MNTKPRKTAENHSPTVSKTMGVTVAKQQPETTMTDNNADNDSTETTDKDDTPTVNGVELDRAAGIANPLAYQIDEDEIAADPATPERNGAEIRDAWAKIAADNDSREATDNEDTHPDRCMCEPCEADRHQRLKRVMKGPDDPPEDDTARPIREIGRASCRERVCSVV